MGRNPPVRRNKQGKAKHDEHADHAQHVEPVRELKFVQSVKGKMGHLGENLPSNTRPGVRTKNARTQARYNNGPGKIMHQMQEQQAVKAKQVQQWLRDSILSGELGPREGVEEDMEPYVSDNLRNFDMTLDNGQNLMCCRKQVREQRKAVDQPTNKENIDVRGAPARIVVNRGEDPGERKKKALRGVQPLEQRQSSFDDSMDDGESIFSVNSGASRHSINSGLAKQKDIKSGFLDKPRSTVLVKLKWPHMNQNPRYVTEAITFNQLSFGQFVGGECRTIMRATHIDEIRGRLRILSKVAYLYDQCKNWEKARATYFAIISSIEEGEATWNSTFGHYDLMCPTVQENKVEQKGGARNRSAPRREYFCKEYQKSECGLQAPHKAWIRNNYETVEHYCAPCHKQKLGKLLHTPGLEKCNYSGRPCEMTGNSP